MNALVLADCLDTRLAEIGRLNASGQSVAVRLALEEMLRCAARLGCRQAVACSDGARAGIEGLLGNAAEP